MDRATFRQKKIMAGTPMRECTVLLYQPLARQAPYHVAVQETDTGIYRLVYIYIAWPEAEDHFNDLVRHPPVYLEYEGC